MRIDLFARPQRSTLREIVAPVAALIVAILIGGFVIALMGRSPLEAANVYFIEPLSQSYSLQAIAVKATPLILIAVGLAFCYRANYWNIGAEGQFIAGGALGGWLGLLTHDGALQGALGSWWILPGMLILGALGGLLYAMIPALLRVWLNVSEILSSLMLVYVAQLGLDWLVRGPWKDPSGHNLPVSVNLDPAATLPLLIPSDGVNIALGNFTLSIEQGSLHWGALLAPIVVVIAAIVFSKTLFGYQVRLVGSAPKAARFGGFNDRAIAIAAFAISGGLAGLAGVVEVSGKIGQLLPSISPGYGFSAIIVAFLGRLSPVGIFIAGLVLALTFVGGEDAQIAMHLPGDLTLTFQGVLLICVLAADVLARYRLRFSLGARS
jgi:simple sugar transport system permease protein